MENERPENKEAIRSIKRTYFTTGALYNFALSHIWAINTLFMISRGLNTAEWNLANGMFALGMVIFEIPTGVIADTLGRKVSFLASLYVLFITTLLYLFYARDLWSFALISIFLGFGFTLFSGAVEAWLYDALEHHGFKGNIDEVFAKNGLITGGVILLGTTSGALIGSINLECALHKHIANHR